MAWLTLEGEQTIKCHLLSGDFPLNHNKQKWEECSQQQPWWCEKADFATQAWGLRKPSAGCITTPTSREFDTRHASRPRGPFPLESVSVAANVKLWAAIPSGDCPSGRRNVHKRIDHGLGVAWLQPNAPSCGSGKRSKPSKFPLTQQACSAPC